MQCSSSRHKGLKKPMPFFSQHARKGVKTPRTGSTKTADQWKNNSYVLLDDSGQPCVFHIHLKTKKSAFIQTT